MLPNVPSARGPWLPGRLGRKPIRPPMTVVQGNLAVPMPSCGIPARQTRFVKILPDVLKPLPQEIEYFEIAPRWDGTFYISMNLLVRRGRRRGRLVF